LEETFISTQGVKPSEDTNTAPQRFFLLCLSFQHRLYLVSFWQICFLVYQSSEVFQLYATVELL